MLNELKITTENTPNLDVFIQIWRRVLEHQKLVVFRLAQDTTHSPWIILEADNLKQFS